MSEQETSGENSNGESPRASPVSNAEESNRETTEDTIISDEDLLLQSSWYLFYKRSRRDVDDPVFLFWGVAAEIEVATTPLKERYIYIYIN